MFGALKIHTETEDKFGVKIEVIIFTETVDHSRVLCILSLKVELLYLLLVHNSG